ncbi:winged helix-turn-helix transcriptional regulator [Candidatus Saccharibacteria bacterium]|nr:winged helix-turn-helix transcriptional regulator [Candidatus Saccharibacteria bacterium]
MTTTTKTTTTSEELNLDEERKIFALHILGDKTRYKMFKLLMKNEEMCVSEIAAKLGVTTSAVSQHFRNFEIVGLVGKVRIGQKICYVLKFDDKLVKQLVDVANN